MNTWNERIKQRRLALGLSYMDLERATGVSHSTFYRYETGEIKDIKLDYVFKIAPALQCNPLWLAGLIDEDLPYANSKNKK